MKCIFGEQKVKPREGPAICLSVLFIFFFSKEKIPFSSFLFSLVDSSNWFLDNELWAEMM